MNRPSPGQATPRDATSPRVSLRELVVLGTSSQVPTRYRNHNGYLLRWDNEGLLFDPGEGTQRQMIYADVSATDVSRVLITHFHGDHCLGLAGLSQRFSLDAVPHPIHCYFPASGQVFYDRMRLASIYHLRATMVPHPIREAGVMDRGRNFTLSCQRLDHGVETFGYRLEEDDGRTFDPQRLREAGVAGPQVGELAHHGEVLVGTRKVTAESVSTPRKGQVIAFVMDTRPCEAAVELARNADLLVVESTYLSSEAREAHEHGHMTAGEALAIANRAGAKRVVLTHFSQRYPSLEPFRAEARALHDDVWVAEDGMRIPVPKRHRSGEKAEP